MVFLSFGWTAQRVARKRIRNFSGTSRFLTSSPGLNDKRGTAVVIGGTGYVGSHVVKQLLSKNYRVRATSRDAKKAAWIKNILSPTSAQNEANKGTGENESDVEIFELSLSNTTPTDAKMDSLLNGTDAVFFCAGFERQDPSTIDFMVNNAQATIQAAKRQKVSCVVLTSSGGSTNPSDHPNEVPKKEHEHWSDPESQKQRGRFSPAAKTLMEIHALAAVGRNQANQIVQPEKAKDAPRLCIMNPNLILGPQLHPGPISGNSLPWIVRILKGEAMNETIPNDSMSIIDVRDLALLHVACFENEDASGRYFGVDKSYPWEEILTVFEDALPSYEKPPRFEGVQHTPTQFDFTRRDSLGVKLRPLKETMGDLIAFLQSKGVLIGERS